MRINPADSSTVQVPTADKLNYLLVTHVRNSVHQQVGREHRRASSDIPDREFTVDQIMAGASGHLSRLFRCHAVFGAVHTLRAELTPPVPVAPSPYR